MTGSSQSVPTTDTPYLSVVVVTRNDDHGGDPLMRLQAFVNAFDAQCRLTGLQAELVVVEWNPPVDRRRLHDLVRVPATCAFALRFVEVPPELHGRLQHGDVLPLFQMIGKNVGIRRARGRFVLATNIDIVFSNELVEYLSRMQLSSEVLYRVDRHDIEPQFPVTGALEEQMAYCQTHQLRLHARDGTHHVDRLGRIVPLTEDTVDGLVVTFGPGWHVREGNSVFGHYRWAGDEAHLIVDRTAAPGLERGAVLSLELEPNAYQPGSWIDAEVLDGGRSLARCRISRVAANVTRLNVLLPDDVARHDITVKVVASSDGREDLPLYERRGPLLYRLYRAAIVTVPMLASPLHEYAPERWQRGMPTAGVAFDRATSAVRLATDPGLFSYAAKFGPLQVPLDGVYEFVVRYTCTEGGLSFSVMDGTTGRWLAAESLEIHEDTVSIRTLSVRAMRGQKLWLFISNSHPDGSRPSQATIHSLRGTTPPDALKARLDSVAIRRSVVGRWARGVHQTRRLVARARDSALYRARRLTGNASTRADAPSLPAAVTPAAETAVELERLATFLRRHRPAHIHQNACGDFQLMARERWFDLRGYAEFTMYSMNIDGLLGVVAHYAGVREQVLEMPNCIYHLEHEKGSGWTPEGEALLKKRIADSGITWLDASTVHIWSAYMEWLRRPMIFNAPDWGFGDQSLRETVLPSAFGTD